MKLADLPVPSTAVAQTARAVVAEFSPPALVNHCERSYLLSTALAQSVGIEVDHELLYVATMLHDLALEETFDNATVPFEIAGGRLASLFCAGAGWPAERRARAADIIVDHMRGDTDPAVDPEGYLLARATSLDISGPGRVAGPAARRGGRRPPAAGPGRAVHRAVRRTGRAQTGLLGRRVRPLRHRDPHPHQPAGEPLTVASPRPVRDDLAASVVRATVAARS
jgi:hypothetical protein